MEVFKYVLAHPAHGLVKSRIGGGYVATLYNTKTKELVEIDLVGITDTLRAVVWPNYVYKYVAPPKPQPQRVPNKKFGKAKKTSRRRRNTLKHKQNVGRATGTLVHDQLQLYINIMDFVAQGPQNSEQRLGHFMNAIKQTGAKNNQLHACTASILETMRDTWGWLPLAAEFCVGDLLNKQKHATAIDLVACQYYEPGAAAPKRQPGPWNTKRLILCELKTGYNNASFMRDNGDLEFIPGVSNSPCHQAMVQLVWGAEFFRTTFGLSREALQLFVIHATTDCAETTQTSQVYLHPVSEDLYSQIVSGLRRAGLL